MCDIFQSMGAETKPIRVVYENPDILAIEKPAGLTVHSDGRSGEKTLVDWLLTNHKVPPTIGEPWTDPAGTLIPRPGIVHRLDRDTSGLLVVAKTQSMFVWFKEQFKQRTIQKKYEALVHGVIHENKGAINRPIGRSGADFRKKSAQRGAVGDMRDAYTEYEVIQRLPSGFTHIALYPKTGRTHQLRVHMKAIHHPIVGDVLYGPRITPNPEPPEHKGLMLRAVGLSVPLPDGTTMNFSCKGLEL
jgi:23S rRNA pseudouridine1911/1915/1917 synthase